MIRNVDKAGLDTLATELLDNRRCRELLPQLNEFENQVFGPDFSGSTECLQPWIDSGCLFYAAMHGEAVAGRSRILSVLSVFITTGVARDRMLLGEISDYQLTPWVAGTSGEQPTIYLSSVVSAAPHHLSAMYDSLLLDVVEFQRANALTFHGGFSIACGTAGLRHMARSGFRLLDEYKYREAYELMVIDAVTAAAPFWTNLLSDQTTFLRRADATEQVRASDLPRPWCPAPGGDDARSVERRLSQAKADRLRRTLDI
jgi:hypothetical protein